MTVNIQGQVKSPFMKFEGFKLNIPNTKSASLVKLVCRPAMQPQSIQITLAPIPKFD